MDLDFIEIGTSDFDTLIQTSNNIMCGISIDPIQMYLDNLPNKDNVIKLNCAISDISGSATVFYIKPSDIVKYSLPNWVRGCNSINHPHPTVVNLLKKQNIVYESVVSTKIIPVMTLCDVYQKYNVTSVKYLKIDTEGHDCNILDKFYEDILKYNLRLPLKILFESNVLTSQHNVKNTIHKYKSIGYIVIQNAGDTILELPTN